MKIKDIIKKTYWFKLEIKAPQLVFSSDGDDEYILTEENDWKLLQRYQTKQLEQKWYELFSNVTVKTWSVKRADRWDDEDETVTLYIKADPVECKEVVDDIIKKHQEWWENEEINKFKELLYQKRNILVAYEKNIEEVKKEIKKLEENLEIKENI